MELFLFYIPPKRPGPGLIGHVYRVPVENAGPARSALLGFGSREAAERFRSLFRLVGTAEIVAGADLAARIPRRINPELKVLFLADEKAVDAYREASTPGAAPFPFAERLAEWQSFRTAPQKRE